MLLKRKTKKNRGAAVSSILHTYAPDGAPPLERKRMHRTVATGRWVGKGYLFFSTTVVVVIGVVVIIVAVAGSRCRRGSDVAPPHHPSSTVREESTSFSSAVLYQYTSKYVRLLVSAGGGWGVVFRLFLRIFVFLSWFFSGARCSLRTAGLCLHL